MQHINTDYRFEPERDRVPNDMREKTTAAYYEGQTALTDWCMVPGEAIVSLYKGEYGDNR